MNVINTYCASCGQRTRIKQVGGMPREVCESCGEVFFRNPLPVAACVIINKRREVLLVRRANEPHRGMWCLPTGFAELEETISEAALRELEEETGVKGSIRRLLRADSHYSEFYGDLLFVIFEVEKIGGTEAAADDADEVAYFALDRVPQLAFTPHALAIQTYADLHRDEWAIQDSFGRLDQAGDEALLSDALVTLVRDQAGEISRRWLAVVRENPSTPSYAAIGREKIERKALNALSEFCNWLGGNEPPPEVEEFYRRLGRERRSQGFALCEVLSALTLLRREIWSFLGDQQALEELLDVYRVMELSRRIVLFFDKALYQTALGYAEGD